jgi:hypothetical protein
MVRIMMNQNSIGIVSKVFPNKIVIEVPDTNKINHNYLGDLYICDGINTFVTIHRSNFQKFIYQIVSLYEQEKAYIAEDEVSKFSGKAYFEAIPLGEIQGEKFEFGLSTFPMIGNDVFLTVNRDVNTIFYISSKKLAVSLGSMASHNNFTPRIAVDDLLTHHMSILGNTGSGKSTTVRKLLHEVIQSIETGNHNIGNTNFLIFDVHDEYGSIPAEHVNLVDVIEDISIPLNTLSLEDWINLVQPSSAVQLPVLMNGLRMANLMENEEAFNDWIKVYCALELYNNVQTEAVAKRTKIISLLGSIPIEGISEVLKKYSSQYGNFSSGDELEFKQKLETYIQAKSTYNYDQCRDKIEQLMGSADCSFNNLKTLERAINMVFLFEEIKGNSQVRSFCSTLMTRISNLVAIYSNTLFDDANEKLMKFEEVISFKKGFTVFKVSSLDDSDLLFFTGYLLRLVYKSQKDHRKLTGEIKQLFHFVFDEAHKYITENKDEGKLQSLKVFEQIAKEGRKFGVFMILASQRPSELSKTVLSQCNNFILHRIRNNVDLEQIRRSIPFIDDTQLTRISYLKTGSALLVGEAFSIPMELTIKGEEYGGFSKTYLPSEIWKNNFTIISSTYLGCLGRFNRKTSNYLLL